ncbi:DoxX family protein [Silvibacterium acidisoli]|uniref:DoxX family protein n=1 Tax=Acidobacteriaceae bacterium ZG23-2 TaxID=2883246 RepID=UPI00406D4C0A
MALSDVTLTAPQPSKAALWTGRVLSALPALMLLSGGIFAWTASPQVVEGTEKMGYLSSLLPVLGTVELVCAVLYIIPQTAVLGALLLTAYFGGAVATHVRVQDPMWPVPIVFGIIIWLGLLLRRPHLWRALKDMH